MAIVIGKRPEQPQSKFFSPKPDTTYKLTLLCNLDEIVSCDQFELWETKPAVIWPDVGPSDPGHELHLRPQWRSFIPVLVDDSPDVVIWAMKRKQHEAIVEAAEAAEEDTKGMIIQFKRIGSGLTTRYTITATPKRARSLPSKITTPQEIIQMLNERPADEVRKEIATKMNMAWPDIVEMFNEKHQADLEKKAAEKKAGKDGEVELL